MQESTEHKRDRKLMKKNKKATNKQTEMEMEIEREKWIQSNGGKSKPQNFNYQFRFNRMKERFKKKNTTKDSKRKYNPIRFSW